MTTIKTTTLRSTELSCPSCIAKIEGALRAVDGVSEATVHFGSGRITVKHDPERVSPQDLAKTIGKVGYQAKVSAF